MRNINIYKLQLQKLSNNIMETVAVGYDRDKVLEWYESKICEPYQEDGVTKYFIKNSKLENYRLGYPNPRIIKILVTVEEAKEILYPIPPKVIL